MRRRGLWKRLLAGLLGGAMLFLGGCGGEPPAEAAGERGEAVTFTDDLGREVTVARPERVAALIGSFADVWCLAGGAETLVAAADDTWTQFDLGLGEAVVNLGGVKTPNVELLLAAEPDFVLGSAKTAADVELEGLLEQAGIPVAYFDISSFSDYLRLLECCTALTGRPERYAAYGLRVREQVEAARGRVAGEAPTVLYVRATGSSCKVKSSQGTVLGEMLADLGCVNIADSEENLLETLSMERILAADPDYIFAVLQGADPSGAEAMLEAALLSNPAWGELTAVQAGRFYLMDQQLYNLKPNARWGEAYENLADILYPAP